MITRKSDAERALSARGAFVMATQGREDGTQYDVNGCVPLSRKIAKALTEPTLDLAAGLSFKSGLSLVPNDDGLFPGMSQTWRAVHHKAK